ncbi:MAG: glycoside hydrolase family 16 protein, partial [Aquaticitalea sp.]
MIKRCCLILFLTSIAVFSQKSSKLIFEEQFDGQVLNGSTWNYELGDGCPNCGWGNNERQLYTKENVKVAAGHLIITATKDA